MAEPIALDVNQLAALRVALVHADKLCRFHGERFEVLGMENERTDAGWLPIPRCDSCKQPYRVRRALTALDRSAT